MQIQTSLDQQVGSKFMHVSNQDLFTMAETLTKALDPTSNVRVIGGESKMTAIATLPGYGFEDSVDGRLFPRVHIHNDNTGGSSLRISVGLFRLICTNGLSIGIPGLSFVHKISHLFTENQKQKILDIPMVAEDIIHYLKDGGVKEQISEARSKKILDPVSVVGNLDIGIKAKDLTISQIIMGSHRREDDPTNAWGLYNMVNESVRLKSRSEFIALNKDGGILEDIMLLAA